MQKWEQIQGVYIHTPFCLQKCLYCDFASYAGADTETMEKYVDAVCSEIMMRSNEVTIADQATLYFGGGTPSLLSEKLLAKLVEALQKNGCWLQPAEATIEVNPGTADLDKLRFFKDLGFDRISFGVQSLNDAELRAVGRIHTANEALDAITMAEKAGFTRVSADLIYGLPEQSLLTLKTSLQNLTAAGLQHLSVYGLTIEKIRLWQVCWTKEKLSCRTKIVSWQCMNWYRSIWKHRDCIDMRFQIMQCQVRSQGITLFTGIICRICLLAVPPAALMAVNVLQQQIL